MKNMKCPVTGVNIPRFLLSVITGFIFVFLYDYVLHGMLLMPSYELTPELWRSESDMQTYFPWMLATQIALVIVTALIYTRNHEGKGIGEGLRFGFMIGLLMGVMMAGSYAWMPIGFALALYWLAGGIVLGLGLGIIFSLTYKPCSDEKAA